MLNLKIRAINTSFRAIKQKKNFLQNMYQKTGQRNLKSLEVHFSCQEKVSFRMKIN